MPEDRLLVSSAALRDPPCSTPGPLQRYGSCPSLWLTHSPADAFSHSCCSLYQVQSDFEQYHTGRWESSSARFGADGTLEELPEQYIPPNFKEWGQTMHEWLVRLAGKQHERPILPHRSDVALSKSVLVSHGSHASPPVQSLCDTSFADGKGAHSLKRLWPTSGCEFGKARRWRIRFSGALSPAPTFPHAVLCESLWRQRRELIPLLLRRISPLRQEDVAVVEDASLFEECDQFRAVVSDGHYWCGATA